MKIKLAMAQANLTIRGGAERVVLKIAEHYNATIYTAEYKKDSTFEEFKDLDIKEIGSSGFYKFLGYGRAAQGLNYGLSFYNYKVKEDYDVLNPHIAPSHWIRHKNDRVLWYCHTPLRDLYDLYYYRQSLRPFAKRTLYSFIVPRIRFIDKRMVNKIKYIVANSENTKNRIKKYYGRNDAVVLNGGIDYKEYKNEGNDRYFFYPSRISPNKRQDYAIRAFKIFKSQNKGMNYRLIISGQVSDDPFYMDYYSKITNMAKNVGGVSILTDVNDKDLIDLYSKATAILYPPINEDYGLVPLEAAASGKPVIVVNEGGPKETVINNKTGFLINNELDMAEKMQKLAEDPQLVENMGKRGRERVKKYYSWNNFFKEFDKLLYKTKNEK